MPSSLLLNLWRLDMLEQSPFDNLQPTIEEFGAKIIDPKQFGHDIFHEIRAELLSTISNGATEALIKYFAPQQISDLASFCRSDKGVKLLSNVRENVADSDSEISFWNGPA
jgi:hypothetical protein